MIKLNLGCRDDVREGWENIDLLHEAPRVIRGDIRELQYEDNSVDEIMADSVLEHVSVEDAARALKEMHRVLKPYGKLTIITPDLDFIVKLCIKGKKKVAIHSLYGIHNEKGQAHKSIFYEDSLRKQLENIGFEVIKRFNNQDDLCLTMQKK